MIRLTLALLFPLLAVAAPAATSWVRTTPASGDLVVSQTASTYNGVATYSTISKAVSALSSSSAGSIFVFPGTYKEQVVINRSQATKIQGYTTDASGFANNEVIITNSLVASAAGSDDASGTVRAESENIAIYNVNIVNSYGHTAAGCQCQAIALSANAAQQGYYGVQISSYQDTLLAQTGVQIYAQSMISGAVDFIFGQNSPAFFYKDYIESTAEGCITASGRASSSSPAIYVFEECQVIAASGAASNTSGNVYLGRPWGDYARVVFRDSYIGSQVNAAGWSVWSTSAPQTADAEFYEYNNTGPGAWNSDRASFSKDLTASEAASYTISTVLGSSYASWVDTAYLF